MDINTPSSAKAPAATRERMSADLRMLVDDAQRLLNDAARYDDAQVAKLKQRLLDEVEHVRTRFADLGGEAQAKVRQAARDADEAVHGHPYAAMGVAAVAGLLLGALLSRR